MDQAALTQGASFSGHERNHLFLNIDGRDFSEVSGVTGLDHPGDSRAFASLDFDRDGWTDVALVNANAPRFQLFANRMGERAGEAQGRVVGVRFEGGNRSAEPAPEWTPRDGYGAMLEVGVGGRTLIREHRAGEGFAAQNSGTLLVGLDGHEQAGALRVKWPSGHVRDTVGVPAGTLVTAYENPSHSPTGAAFVFEPYAADAEPVRPLVASAPGVGHVDHDELGGSRSTLVMYTTMATWCAPCLAELPDMERLRATFTVDELEIIGVPYDDEEDSATILAWSEANEPAYRILRDLPVSQRQLIRHMLEDELKLEGLPATLITDREGRVVMTRWGPPSVSEIRKLLAEQASAMDD